MTSSSIDSLFGEDEALLAEHHSYTFAEEFSKTFVEYEESEGEEVNPEEFSLAIYLLGLAQLHPVSKEDLVDSISSISKYNSYGEWKNPTNLAKPLKHFLYQMKQVISSYDLPLHPSVNKEAEQQEIEETTSIIGAKEKIKDFLFSDEEEVDNDDKITQEELDKWWNTSVEFGASTKQTQSENLESDKDFAEINAMLQDELDYDTLGEDLEANFLSIGNKGTESDREESEENSLEFHAPGDIDDEGDIEIALSFVLGADNVIPKVAKGKVDKNAAELASHRLLMVSSDLDFSDDEIDIEIMKQGLETTDEVFHDEIEESEDEDAAEQDNGGDDDNDDDSVEYEYVDEDGNPIEGSIGSDGEYEIIYEEESPESSDDFENEASVSNEANIDDSDHEEFVFDDDLDDLQENSISTSHLTAWDDLLADI